MTINTCRRLVGCAALLSLLAACQQPVDPTQLPSVPTVDTTNYQPAVRDQLDAARAGFDAAPLKAERNGQLAMLYRVYRRFDAAEALFARARVLAPRKLDWAYYHGESLEQLARYDDALAAFDAVAARDAADVAVRVRQARTMLALGRFEDVLSITQPLLRSHANLGDAHVLTAQALTRAGRIDDAIKAWQEALAQFGGFRVGHYGLSQLYRRQGRREDAERQLWLFETSRVEEPPAYDPRMVALFRLSVSDRSLVRAAQGAKARGEANEALDLLEQALQRHPANLETRVSLINGYAAEGRFDDAQRHVQAGLAQDPAHVELGLAVARLDLTQGRASAALERLESICERSPRHALARAWLGRVHDARGNAEAGEHFARAVELDASQPDARRFYVNWLMRAATPAQAEAALAALSNVPSRDAPLTLLALAETRLKLGQRDAALAALDTGIERARWLGLTSQATRLSNRRAQIERSGG